MNLFCVMALQLINDIHKERLSVVSLACVFSLLYGHSYTSTHCVCVKFGLGIGSCMFSLLNFEWNLGV